MQRNILGTDPCTGDLIQFTGCGIRDRNGFFARSGWSCWSKSSKKYSLQGPGHCYLNFGRCCLQKFHERHENSKGGRGNSTAYRGCRWGGGRFHLKNCQRCNPQSIFLISFVESTIIIGLTSQTSAWYTAGVRKRWKVSGLIWKRRLRIKTRRDRYISCVNEYHIVFRVWQSRDDFRKIVDGYWVNSYRYDKY